MTTSSGHALLSPSSAHRWLACPASIRLSAQLPEPPTSPAAQEGTIAHEIAAILASHRLGLTTQKEHDQQLARWHREQQSSAHDQLSLIGFAQDWAEMLAARPNTHAQIEHHLLSRIDGVHGTADAILYDQTTSTLTIADYKYGRGVCVEAENNPQLLFYASGAMRQFELIHKINTIILIIYQPRIDGCASEWTISPAELADWETSHAQPGAAATRLPDAPAIPSAEACRWCPAAGVCTTRQAWAAIDDFGPPMLAQTEDLPELLEQAERAEQWARDVRAHTTQALNAGEHVEGWKLVAPRPRRTIVDHARAIDKLRAAGYAEAQISSPRVASFTSLDRTLGGRDQVDQLLGDLVGTSSGNVCLVRETDPRPPTTQLQQDFGRVE